MRSDLMVHVVAVSRTKVTFNVLESGARCCMLCTMLLIDTQESAEDIGMLQQHLPVIRLGSQATAAVSPC